MHTARMRSEPAQDAGRIKGAALREFLAWYETEYGRARLVELASAVPVGLRGGLDLDFGRESLGILSSRWYAGEAIHGLVDAMFAGLDAGERAIMIERSSDAVITATLHGVYRILFDWFVTPERYAKWADRLWRSYYDTGVMTVEQVTPLWAVTTIRDWRSHHPTTCEMNRAAGAAIYRALGCRGVVTRRELCVSEGATECRYVSTWDARR